MTAARPHRIAMLSIHASPLGPLGAPDTGGMSVCIQNLARELGDRGHRVDIYTGRAAQEDPAARHIHRRVRLIHLESGAGAKVPKEKLPPWVPAYARALDDILQRADTAYDVVHSHYWLSGAVARKSEALQGLPHLISFHTTALAKTARCRQEQEPTHRIDTEHELIRRGDRIVVASTREREGLMHSYGAAPEKIEHVPWGVSHDRFQPMDRRAARERLGLDAAETLALFVGRMTPVKGVAELLGAMARLRHQRRLRLVLVGGARGLRSQSNETVRLVQSLGLSERVSFVGRMAHDALPFWYSAADCLVLPSHDETFGLVALESLACGTPVVATRVGAVENFLRDGRTGILVDEPSPVSLARAMESLLTGTDERRLSSSTIAQSVSAHTWSAAAARLLQAYRAATRGTGKARSREFTKATVKGSALRKEPDDA